MKSHKSFLARKTNGHTPRLDGFITLMRVFLGKGLVRPQKPITKIKPKGFIGDFLF